jgi:hypothetical protein
MPTDPEDVPLPTGDEPADRVPPESPLFLDGGGAETPPAMIPEPIPAEPSGVWDLAPEPADLPPVGDPPSVDEMAALGGGDDVLGFAPDPVAGPSAAGGGEADDLPDFAPDPVVSSDVWGQPTAEGNGAAGDDHDAVVLTDPDPAGLDDSGALWSHLAANPPSSVMNQPPSSVLGAGPGSDVIRGLFPGAGPGSHLFDAGHPPAPSGVPADPGELTDSIPQSELFRPQLEGSGNLRGLPTTDRLATEGGTPPPPGDSGMVELPDPGPDGSSARRKAVAQLFAELDAIPDPPAHHTARGRPAAGGEVDPAGPDFNETDPSQSGSNLFADPSVPDMALPGASEVVSANAADLLNPYAGPPSGMLVGPASSIFTRDEAGPPVGRIDLATGDDDPDATDAFPMPDPVAPSSLVGADDLPKSPLHDMLASGIHRRADLAADLGQVSFDVPDGPPSAILRAEASGMIDWAAPPSMAEDSPTPNLSDDDDRPVSVDFVLTQGEIDLPDVPAVAPRPRPSSKAMTVQAATLDEVGADTLPGTGRRGDRIGGALAGLVTGVAATAAAFLGGLVPSPDSPAGPAVAAVAPNKTPPAATAPAAAVPADGKALLAAGDPAAAVKALDGQPEDAPADIRLARGQARVMARIRELASAAAPVPADDAALKKAEADLSAAVGGADKKAAVDAALYLGLLKEVTGDVDGAKGVYAAAAAKFPASKAVFDAALNRLRAMGGPADGAMLPPAKADDLVRAAVFAVVLLQPPAAADAPAAPPDEPGVLFWQAVTDASAGRYAEAVAGIAQARKLHDKRRLAVIGRGGVNPTSDPLEQIFLRCCDDLAAYWTLKRDLYGHPSAGAVVQADGVTKALDRFVAAEAAAKKALDDVKAAQAASAEMATRLRQQTEEAATVAKARDDAATRAADAAAKLKAADATLAAVTAELKASGLLADGDGPAKLPAAVKAAVSSTDAKKATEALAAATRDAAAARAEAKAAADAAARADETYKATTAKLTADAERAKLDAEAAMKKSAADLAAAKKALADAEATARQAAFAEAADREKDLRAKLAAALAARDQDLAAQAARHDQVVATMRSGGKVVASAGERAARDRAAKAYADGVQLYRDGRPTEAEAMLMAATRDDPNDARYWYFLGLTRWARGNKASADAAFKHGAELEARGLPTAGGVGASLEWVQGPARQALAAFRP